VARYEEDLNQPTFDRRSVLGDDDLEDLWLLVGCSVESGDQAILAGASHRGFSGRTVALFFVGFAIWSGRRAE